MTLIYYGNKSCAKFLENLVFHDRSKHIKIKYHFIWDMVQKGAMKLQYISIDEKIVYFLTKPLYFIFSLSLCPRQCLYTLGTRLVCCRTPPLMRGSVNGWATLGRNSCEVNGPDTMMVLSTRNKHSWEMNNLDTMTVLQMSSKHEKWMAQTPWCLYRWTLYIHKNWIP